MVHAFIGLIVGIIMGLTGAGGALISIPLYISLLSLSVKQATILSLIAVVFGTSANLFRNLNKVDLNSVFYFAVVGAIANFLTLDLKKTVPTEQISFLLTVIGFYSLYSVWKPRTPGLTSQLKKRDSYLKFILTGSLLGVLTTLTGLGGGVLLVPILISFFGKTYFEALPTSLATILIISLISFLLQIDTALDLINVTELSFMAFGAIFAFMILKFGLKHVSESVTTMLRKVTFTVVTVYSVSTVLFKT